METAGALNWRKSSYSSSNGGDCIEVSTTLDTVAVRDSKRPNGTDLTFTPGKWLAFTRRMKASRMGR